MHPGIRRTIVNIYGAIFSGNPTIGKNHIGDIPNPLLANGCEEIASRAAQHDTPTLVQTLQTLRTRGVRCVAAHPHTEQRTLFEADFTGDCCIVFGSEGTGISPAVLAACDEAVAIPMPPKIDSLNVGAAAAVFLYEASRQRQSRITRI